MPNLRKVALCRRRRAVEGRTCPQWKRTGVPTGRTGSAAQGRWVALGLVCPRQIRIASTTLGWAMAEMTAALPPHFLHRRISSRNTRIISSDQVKPSLTQAGGIAWGEFYNRHGGRG
jgi:hypothetical protein